MLAQGEVTSSPAETMLVGKIPVRNIWLLMLYASDLFRMHAQAQVDLEANPDDLPDLVAELLARMVERRLRRNLSFGYQPRDAVLHRVRGRVDLLTTERRQLLFRGKVACSYEELTIDTPRNRYVRAALERIARLVKRRDLRQRVRTLAGTLGRMGVSSVCPTRQSLGADRLSQHDADDRYMLAAARLAFDLALPTEEMGHHALGIPERDAVWMRKLFEKAVAGFYKVCLSPQGWQVSAGKTLSWAIDAETPGIREILPTMVTDVVLDPPNGGRIVIDTKFTAIVTQGWRREETLSSGYLYQMYAYLRSQVGRGDERADHAQGILLHPAIDRPVDEIVTIQGHPIRFATVDLAGGSGTIRQRLIDLVHP